MGDFLFEAGFLDAQDNGHALLDIENVLVFGAVGAFLLLLAVAVEVENVDMIEAVHQGLSHPSEGRIVEVAVVSNEP